MDVVWLQKTEMGCGPDCAPNELGIDQNTAMIQTFIFRHAIEEATSEAMKHQSQLGRSLFRSSILSDHSHAWLGICAKVSMSPERIRIGI